MTHVGTRRIHFEATDSTNDRAAELARDPAFAGTVVTADVQTHGRGQHGRVWQSPPGSNVLMSVLLYPPPELRRPAVLTAFAAVAVAETVEHFTSRPVTVKWPNDVLVEGKKIAGILIEGGRHADFEPHSIVGIGLNVNQSGEDFVSGGLDAATSLALLAERRHDIAEVTRHLIGRLDAEYGSLLAGGVAELERRWVDRLGVVGREATIALMDGDESRGVVSAVGFDRVVLDDGRAIRSERIRHVRVY